ncbi:hypothetical protein [Porphyromonas endodontalis]
MTRLSEQQRSIKCVQILVLAGSLALSSKVVNLWIRIAPTGWSAGGGCAVVLLGAIARLWL